MSKIFTVMALLGLVTLDALCGGIAEDRSGHALAVRPPPPPFVPGPDDQAALRGMTMVQRAETGLLWLVAGLFMGLIGMLMARLVHFAQTGEVPMPLMVLVSLLVLAGVGVVLDSVRRFQRIWGRGWDDQRSQYLAQRRAAWDAEHQAW